MVSVMHALTQSLMTVRAEAGVLDVDLLQVCHVEARVLYAQAHWAQGLSDHELERHLAALPLEVL